MEQTVPVQPEVQVPTQEQLTAQISQITSARSLAKDQIEVFEKQLPVLTGMLQLLQAQEEVGKLAAAKATAKAELNKD